MAGSGQVSRWANLLVKRINRHLRELAIQDAKKSMEYLNTELTKTHIVELQQAIANLLEARVYHCKHSDDRQLLEK